ncbi:MAG: MBL fold metallo-hydrolase [Betaproteobacteria bacterium]|nr:MAG: MBL fold metallo-hydrolase [Betaproteobacteria bacterium]
MRFASLASGSKGNCLVAEADRTRVLIDCGLNLRDTERRLARLGLAPSDIAALLVTHEHGDHSGGVFDFAAAHALPVYLTYGTMTALKAEGKVTEGVKTVIIDGRQAFTVGGMQVIPFTVPHDAREPVQYVLADGDKRLGVLTDIGALTAHVEQTLSGLHALVLECNYDHDMLWNGTYPKWLKQRIAGPFGHLDNADSAKLLAALDCSRLQHLVGAHLSEQNNRPEIARAALAAAIRCEESWISLATQAGGFGWRDLL